MNHKSIRVPLRCHLPSRTFGRGCGNCYMNYQNTSAPSFYTYLRERKGEEDMGRQISFQINLFTTLRPKLRVQVDKMQSLQNCHSAYLWSGTYQWAPYEVNSNHDGIFDRQPGSLTWWIGEWLGNQDTTTVVLTQPVISGAPVHGVIHMGVPQFTDL